MVAFSICKVLLVPKAMVVHQAQLEVKEHKVLKVLRVLMALKEHKEQLVLKDQEVPKELSVPKVVLVTQELKDP